jgi:hypothetical protein
MKSHELIPVTKDTPVVRTDFDNVAAWNTICELIRQPVNDAGEDFYAYVDFVDNPIFRNLSEQELLEMVPPRYVHTFLFVVDQTATITPEFPILVIDLSNEPGRTFRAIPSQVCGIQNNLSISNMDFREFADNVDQDGVFRGFKES